MGRRSATESVLGVLAAFIEHPTWEQAELARRIGCTTRTLRKWLDELSTFGVPLERQAEEPKVYWSLPNDWFPRGHVITNADASTCVRLLARLPRSETRDHLIHRLLGPAAIAFARVDREEHAPFVLPALEDSMQSRTTLRIFYESLHSASKRRRFVSVHHIDYDSPVRFVATCHEHGTLRWFRADRIHASEHRELQVIAVPAQHRIGSKPTEVTATVHSFVRSA